MCFETTLDLDISKFVRPQHISTHTAPRRIGPEIPRAAMPKCFTLLVLSLFASSEAGALLFKAEKQLTEVSRPIEEQPAQVVVNDKQTSFRMNDVTTKGANPEERAFGNIGAEVTGGSFGWMSKLPLKVLKGFYKTYKDAMKKLSNSWKEKKAQQLSDRHNRRVIRSSQRDPNKNVKNSFL